MRPAYIAGCMKRIVLALLALLGLVAHGAPAQAGACGIGIAQVGLVARPGVQGQALAARSLPTATIVQPRRVQRACGPTLAAQPVLAVLTPVQLGPDRAHE